ncbi:MAG: tRNA uridine-5-carboxymethylaminomethyl(34) synthesis GTPase MnmE [Candidatus Binataceae bacterium]|nr:tRNA uridine-5-carboxymethylaminomethyl(34) synthesis GTPase MnmE [Candidatus Binataceae bacterium]
MSNPYQIHSFPYATLSPLMYLHDTIVAPATPPGVGAVAIVRLSGPRALAIARTLWHPLAPAALTAPAARRLTLGELRDPATGAPIDQAMLVVFAAPHTLTGEDVAELQCHGGPYIVRRVVALATAQGARRAEPGEFTRRAYLNGRLDLTAAEAIADLIAARGDAALAGALAQLSGALATRVDRLRMQVIAIRAHLEVEIDFADEDLALPSRAEIANSIAALAADIEVLHASFARGRIVREGARAAIVGKPNAGKSSVLNLLLGADRAIVTPIPGTTRDVIEDSVALGPWPLVLRDTAGLRDSTDPVERLGIDRARRAAAEADLIIAVFDASRPFDADDAGVIAALADRRGVALLNKRDLPPALSAKDLRDRGVILPIVELSALVGDGVGDLRARLEQLVAALAGGDGAAQESGGASLAISRERHRDALAAALAALRAAHRGVQAAMPPEIVAVDVAAAADALGAITGAVETEDVLDAVFRDFCIGK